MSGSVRWKNTEITINLQNAANVNLRHGVVDVLQLPMEQAATFMELIRSAGRLEMRLPGRCYHVNGYYQRVPEGYVCQGFVILGYIDGEQPKSKPRKPGRIKIVE